MPYLTLRIVRLQLPADVNTAGDGANPAAITAGVRLNNTALEDCFEVTSSNSWSRPLLNSPLIMFS